MGRKTLLILAIVVYFNNQLQAQTITRTKSLCLRFIENLRQFDSTYHYLLTQAQAAHILEGIPRQEAILKLNFLDDKPSLKGLRGPGWDPENKNFPFIPLRGDQTPRELFSSDLSSIHLMRSETAETPMFMYTILSQRMLPVLSGLKIRFQLPSQITAQQREKYEVLEGRWGTLAMSQYISHDDSPLKGQAYQFHISFPDHNKNFVILTNSFMSSVELKLGGRE